MFPDLTYLTTTSVSTSISRAFHALVIKNNLPKSETWSEYLSINLICAHATQSQQQFWSGIITQLHQQQDTPPHSSYTNCLIQS